MDVRRGAPRILSAGEIGPMQSYYYLTDHVRFCEFDDGGVFLDLKEQQYYGISQAELQHLRSCLRGCERASRYGTERTRGDDEHKDIAETLERFRLLTRDSRKGRKFTPLDIRCTESIPLEGIDETDPSIHLVDITRFVRASFIGAFLLRFRSLEHIVWRVERRKRRAAHGESPENAMPLGKLTKLYRRLTPLVFTTTEFCLRDALVLTEFLALYGVYPTWVIGVRTRPFGAHSWVQYRRLLLNDALEHVETFTPILAI